MHTNKSEGHIWVKQIIWNQTNLAKDDECNAEPATQLSAANFISTLAGGKFHQKEWVREWLPKTNIAFDELDEDHWQLNLRWKVQHETQDQSEDDVGTVLVDGTHRLTFGSNCHEHLVVDERMDLKEEEHFANDEVPINSQMHSLMPVEVIQCNKTSGLDDKFFNACEGESKKRTEQSNMRTT